MQNNRAQIHIANTVSHKTETYQKQSHEFTKHVKSNWTINAKSRRCTNVYYLVGWPHSVRRWGPLLQVSHVPWSVCRRVCLLAKLRVLQKRLNQSRYRLKGADSYGRKEPLLKRGAHWCHLSNTIERSAASMRPYVEFVWPLGSLLSHRSTQPCIPQGRLIEYQLRLG